MNLFDKTLRLGLLCGVSLAFGCIGTDGEDTAPDTKESDADTDSDTDTDTDTDSDTDTDTEVETGQLAFVILEDYTVDLTGEAPAFVTGHYGYSWYSFYLEGFGCYAIGELAEEEGAEMPEAECPDCTWAFNLAPNASTEIAGDYCEDLLARRETGLEAYPVVAENYDGKWDLTVGFAPYTSYTNPNDTYALYNVIWKYFKSEPDYTGEPYAGWYLTNWNLGTSAPVTYDEEAGYVSAYRIPTFAYNGSYYAYYYYYYL